MQNKLKETVPSAKGLALAAPSNPARQAAALLLALLLALTVFAGCKDSGGAGGEAKSITVTVQHKDGSTKDFAIETAEEMLGPALLHEKLIEGEEGQYGLFVKTVDGETADESSQEWWCLTVDGESATTGVDSTPVVDGGVYGLVLTVGY